MNNPASLRERLYIMVFQTDTVAGRRFDKILLLIILASLVTVILDSIDEVHQATPACWPVSNGALPRSSWPSTSPACTARAAALCLQFLWAGRFTGVVGIIALYYSDAQYLLIVRVIRMLRIFRVLKLSPYLKQAHYLIDARAVASRRSSCSWSRYRPWSRCSAR